MEMHLRCIIKARHQRSNLLRQLSPNKNLHLLHRQSSPQTRGLRGFKTFIGDPTQRRSAKRRTLRHLAVQRSLPGQAPRFEALLSPQVLRVKRMRPKTQSMVMVHPLPTLMSKRWILTKTSLRLSQAPRLFLGRSLMADQAVQAISIQLLSLCQDLQDPNLSQNPQPRNPDLLLDPKPTPQSHPNALLFSILVTSATPLHSPTPTVEVSRTLKTSTQHSHSNHKPSNQQLQNAISNPATSSSQTHPNVPGPPNPLHSQAHPPPSCHETSGTGMFPQWEPTCMNGTLSTAAC